MVPEHFMMGQERGIVEVFCAFRAVLYASLALDADAGDTAYVIRIDGTHGTDLGAKTAADTFVRIRLRFRF
jgi:hypothetical protein